MPMNAVVRFRPGPGDADGDTRTYRNVDTMDVQDGSVLVIRAVQPLPAAATDKWVQAVIPMSALERAELVKVD